MDKLSFLSSQAASPVPNLPSLSKTKYDQRFPKKSSIIKSQVDCKSSNVNLSTFSSNELTPINPLQTQSTIIDPVQSKSVKSPMQKWPQKEVKGWNPLHNMLAAALDMVEKGFIQDLEKRDPLPDTANPEVQLAGNFFPVPENAVQHELEIEGKLPEGLEGVYVRNGANPKYRPLAGHHLFDGDGMLHAVRIKQGIASYANRFTKTHRFLEEERIGRPIFPKAIGELHGHSGIARLLLFYARACFGLINGNQGMGVANAGVIFFNGQLLAMSEDDLPYAIHITSNGDLQTLGKYDFNGQLKTSMIAHPKVDLESGELFALSYDVLKKPYLRYFKINKDGKKELEVNIDGVNEPTMMHDFAITQHFVIIPDQQVTFKLHQMLRGGSPVNYNKEKTSRFGVLPRGATDDRAMKWIDVPDCFCFHLWNAWEEDGGDEVVVIGSCMTPPDSIFNEYKDSLQSVLTEIRLNLSTLTSHRRVISPSLNLEAGQVNRRYLGKKTQYAYLAIAHPWPKVCGVAKINLLAHSHTYPNTNIPHTQLSLDADTHMPSVANSSHPRIHSSPSGIANSSHIPINSHCISSHLPITNNNTPDHNTYVPHKKNRTNTNPTPNHDNVVASFMYPPNCFGGEPMFVPRSLDPSTPEDDGYVLTFMHNEETCESKLLVLDASSPSLDMLASIKIPSRVPYGFHGTFITSQELEHQKANQI